jgi:protein-S-isoprenylcysteine O-methyltransferase Ste14
LIGLVTVRELFYTVGYARKEADMLPLIPLYLPWFAPFHPFAPLIWLSGVVFLGLTRFTHQLAGRGKLWYYFFSSVTRPLGVLLIFIGWMAVTTPQPAFAVPDMSAASLLFYFGWDAATGPQIMFWINLLSFLGWLASFAFGVWAVKALGVRRSFLFRRAEEGLFTRGPYALVRHPQFLSAIGITFFCAVLFPAGQWATGSGQTWIFTETSANWAVFTIALWVLSIIEDRELAKHFGKEYADYRSRVPRIFPN